jgi:thymidylate kinase
MTTAHSDALNHVLLCGPSPGETTPSRVALVGLDGAGKTTVASLLQERHPDKLRRVYMGDNIDSASHRLFTTRWLLRLARSRLSALCPVPSATDGEGPRPRTLSTLPFRILWGLNRVLDEAYREQVSRRYVRAGLTVVFDRHFLLDYSPSSVGGRASLRRRLRTGLRRKLLAQPDFVVVLDVPPELAFARKGEFSIEHLRRRRGEYLDLAARLPRMAVVDATLPPTDVVEQVFRAIQHPQRELSAP